MQISAQKGVLSLLIESSEAYFFDRPGHFFAAWVDGWFFRHGRSGRSIAHRWNGSTREVQSLSPAEMESQLRRRRSALELALRESSSETRPWIESALAHDRNHALKTYQKTYRPVGILPPDQYNAVVLQLTVGCGWNGCHFCTIYRGQSYRAKSKEELVSHVDQVSAFFGEGLSMARSIFLGEASALDAPVERLVEVMESAMQKLVPQMPNFRGFYAFNEPMNSSCRTGDDFRRLAKRGLKRLYYGLETGCSDLRERLGKPGTLELMEDSIASAKAAGIRVAVILLVGVGGTVDQDRHREESLAFLRRLPLDQGDFVYLSPLRGPDGTSEPALSDDEVLRQITQLRKGIRPLATASVYDIREFVY